MFLSKQGGAYAVDPVLETKGRRRTKSLFLPSEVRLATSRFKARSMSMVPVIKRPSGAGDEALSGADATAAVDQLKLLQRSYTIGSLPEAQSGRSSVDLSAAPPPVPSPPPSPPAPTQRPSTSAISDSIAQSLAVQTKPIPTVRLNHVMAVVYPLSLGLMEGVTQLTIKALSAIAGKCSEDGYPTCCFANGWTWAFLFVFASVGVLTVIWLKLVYTRYETTTGLPVEYGTVHCCSIMGGLIFYQEAKAMQAWQVALALSGLATVVAGVAISTLKELPFCASPRARVSNRERGASGQM